MTVKNVDGTVNSGGQITHYLRSPIILGERVFMTQFYVADLGPDEVILGMTFLRERNPIINWKEGWMTIGNSPHIRRRREATYGEVVQALQRYCDQLNAQAKEAERIRRQRQPTVESETEEPLPYKDTLPADLPYILEEVGVTYPDFQQISNHKHHE